MIIVVYIGHMSQTTDVILIIIIFIRIFSGPVVFFEDNSVVKKFVVVDD